MCAAKRVFLLEAGRHYNSFAISFVASNLLRILVCHTFSTLSRLVECFTRPYEFRMSGADLVTQIAVK